MVLHQVGVLHSSVPVMMHPIAPLRLVVLTIDDMSYLSVFGTNCWLVRVMEHVYSKVLGVGKLAQVSFIYNYVC